MLDIGLPDITGYDLAGELRARQPAMRLVALTGYGSASDAEAARQAGFDAHCVKPIRIDDLTSTIQSAGMSF